MRGKARTQCVDRDAPLHAHQAAGAIDIQQPAHAVEPQQAPVGERDVAEGVPRADDPHALAVRGGPLQRGGDLRDRGGPLDRRRGAALIAGPVAPLGAAAVAVMLIA